MKVLPKESELKASFSDFLELALDMLLRCGENSKYLKVAAVNAQIALELFLKYYFKRIGQENSIRRKKGQSLMNDYVDFSQILAYFYSMEEWSYGEKKELVRLMEARNSIVHRAQDSAWDEDLAVIIARVFFFIHATSWNELGESVLFNNYNPHPISKLAVWRKGAESFAGEISAARDVSCQRCLTCGAIAAMSADAIPLDESTNDEKDIVCLCCLTSINIEEEARLLDCYVCDGHTYWMDAYNEQENQLYVGKCTECQTDSWIRKCFRCGEFYHPSAISQVRYKKLYFCSADCCESHKEGEKFKC